MIYISFFYVGSMNAKKSGDSLVDSLTVIWSIIPKQYRSHEYFLNPVEFIDAYRAIIENPPTVDEYREAKAWAMDQYEKVSTILEKSGTIGHMGTARIQTGGNRFVILQQIFFTLMMLFLFVYFRSHIQDYGAGFMQNPGRFFIVNILGDYTNSCDIILMLINVLMYIVLVKDMAKVFVQKRVQGIFEGWSVGQILQNVMGNDAVIYSPGNTVNWLLMETQHVDVPKIIPTLQRYIVQGLQRFAPRFTESLTNYVSRNHPVLTVGFFTKHLLQWTPTIFNTVMYSYIFKQTITQPIASLLHNLNPVEYANCAAYLPSVTGGRRRGTRKSRKHKGHKRVLKSRKRV